MGKVSSHFNRVALYLQFTFCRATSSSSSVNSRPPDEKRGFQWRRNGKQSGVGEREKGAVAGGVTKNCSAGAGARRHGYDRGGRKSVIEGRAERERNRNGGGRRWK
ncbi:unnamed protein product [Linum trigynum]